MRLKHIIAAGWLVLPVTACSSDNEPSEPEADNSTTETEPSSEKREKSDSGQQTTNNTSDSFTVETIAANLDVPWAIQVQDGQFYVTERSGTIARIEKDGSIERQPLSLTEEIASEGEGGLLGFQLSPDFGKSQKAYIYHTYEQNQSLANRIVSVTLENGTWQEEDILLEDIPGGRIHNGGRLKIGPDERLYATAGDAGTKNQAQQRSTLGGSILRIALDGSIPEDNPDPDSYVYSYGHRNPQGISWNTEDTLYSSEHGSSAHDEINAIEPGENYGWPEITGDESRDNMQSPLLHSGKETWAPSGTAFDGKNDFYVTGLRGTQLMRVNVEEETMEVVYSGEGRLRDVLIADGAMYVVTNNRDGRGTPEEEDDLLLKLENFEEHVQ